MSYILDALKKSEQERKLGNLPDISSDHQLLQKTHDRNWVLYVTLALMFFLAIILATLIFYYVNDSIDFDNKLNSKNNIENIQTESVYNEDTDNSNEGFETITDEGITIDSSGAEIIRPSQERRDSLQEQQQQDSKNDADFKREYEEVFQEKNPDNSLAQDKDSDTSLPSEDIISDEANADSAEPKWEDYESIAALNPSLKQQIPGIIVSTHIFSSVKSFRKVTVNGFNVHSGTEISDGLVVEHILEEGVIFSFQGVFFRMKALEEWEG